VPALRAFRCGLGDSPDVDVLKLGADADAFVALIVRSQDSVRRGLFALMSLMASAPQLWVSFTAARSVSHLWLGGFSRWPRLVRVVSCSTSRHSTKFSRRELYIFFKIMCCVVEHVLVEYGA
jgi:hypothetical protein